jgi:hypothetical protein
MNRHLNYKPNKKDFGYCPIYVQHLLKKYECPNIPNSMKAFHIPLNFNCHSILNLSLMTNFDLALVGMEVHYLHRSNKIMKSTKLEYEYDVARKEYTIKNYHSDNHLMLCREGTTPYLEIVIMKEKDNDHNVREPSITIGYTSCSWRPMSLNDKMDTYAVDTQFDFVECLQLIAE